MQQQAPSEKKRKLGSCVTLLPRRLPLVYPLLPETIFDGMKFQRSNDCVFIMTSGSRMGQVVG
jgi:hypothetical protein